MSRLAPRRAPAQPYPSVTLVCLVCGSTARRQLLRASGCRGIRETPCEPAKCPRGHGVMVRQDGRRVGW